MPAALTIFAVVVVGWYFLYNYVKVEVLERIIWEFCFFTSEYISEVQIVLPSNCKLPYYLKRNVSTNARDDFYEWVPSDELVPTGYIMVGNKGMEWIEVARTDYTRGFVPRAVVKLAKAIPYKYLQKVYQ